MEEEIGRSSFRRPINFLRKASRGGFATALLGVAVAASLGYGFDLVASAQPAPTSNAQGGSSTTPTTALGTSGATPAAGSACQVSLSPAAVSIALGLQDSGTAATSGPKQPGIATTPTTTLGGGVSAQVGSPAQANCQAITLSPAALAILKSTLSDAASPDTDNTVVAPCPNTGEGVVCTVTFTVSTGAWFQSFCYTDSSGDHCLAPYDGDCFEVCTYRYDGGGPGAMPKFWIINGNDVRDVSTS